jgi:hypothetical protein
MTALAASTTPQKRSRVVLFSAVLAVAITLALQPLFVFALIEGRSHTDLGPIRAHVLQAFEAGVLDVDGHPRAFIHRGGHQFTECIALNVSLDSQTDVLRTALFPVLHGKFQTSCASARLAGLDQQAAGDPYVRYWHGYRLYLWPMLEHFSLATVRAINSLAILLALAACYFGFRAVVGATPAAVFMIVLLSLTDLLRIGVNTPHTVSMLVILFGTACFAALYERTRSAPLAIAIAALCGALFNFFDFLINPPMMPMLFAFLVLAAAQQSDQKPVAACPVNAGWLAVLVVASWFGAYAATWMTKWGLAVWLSPNPEATRNDILSQIGARLYGHEALDAPIVAIPGYPTIRMIGKSLISYGIVFAVPLAFAIWRHIGAHRSLFDRRAFVKLISPVLIAVAWFELLSNHTQTHMHFTYRSAAAGIAIVLTAALLASRKPTSLLALAAALRQRKASAPQVDKQAA